jgi:hypothetical protein
MSVEAVLKLLAIYKNWLLLGWRSLRDAVGRLIEQLLATPDDVILALVSSFLVLLVLALFFVTPFLRSPYYKFFRRLERSRGAILLIVLLLGLLLGWLGSGSGSRYSDALAPDHLYQAWSQFSGNGEVGSSDPLATRLCRVLGLTFLALAAYEAFVRVFAEPLQYLRMRRSRGHTLICGLGRIGTALGKERLKAKKKVTIIEKNASRPEIEELRNLGAIVMIADATDFENLRKASCHRSAEIFVVTGSDEANLDIAADIMEHVRGVADYLGISRTMEPPSLHVHLHQMRLESQLFDIAKKQDRKKAVDANSPATQPQPQGANDAAGTRQWIKRVRAFNPLEESMIQMFDDHVLPLRPKCREEVAHYVLVGFGKTNQQLALFLAENAHFSNLKRARMTIAYRSSEAEAVESFKALYPKFFPHTVFYSVDPWKPTKEMDDWGYGVELFDGVGKEIDRVDDDPTKIDFKKSKGVAFAVNGGFDLMEGGATSPKFVEKLLEVCKSPEVRPIVFLGNSVDEENCAEAIEVRQLLDERLKTRGSYDNDNFKVSVFVYVPDHHSLSNLINRGKESEEEREILAWGDCTESCRYNRLTNTLRHNLAEAIYKSYPPNASRKLSDATAGEYQSNRKAAIHVNAKLAVFGLKIVEELDGQVPTCGRERVDSLQDEVSGQVFGNDSAVQIEHHRYLAERLLQDWGLGEKKEPENRERPGIVNWPRVRCIDSETNRKQHEQLIEKLSDLLPTLSAITLYKQTTHLNPNGSLLNECVWRLKVAKRIESIWARKATKEEPIGSQESGWQIAQAGDYVCRGDNGKFWVQSERALLDSYVPSGGGDGKGYQQFRPKGDAEQIEAAEVDEPFCVWSNGKWLKGKPGDYVVRRQNDPNNIWIVDRSSFENFYQFVTNS